jgi:tetratricopeptide (TPR) repeat protein
MLKKLSIILSLVFCLLPVNPVFAADMRVPELRTSSFQTNLLLGISKSFNVDESGADACLKKAIELEPENPTGYALEAMLHLFAYDMCFSLDQRQKEKEAILYFSEEALARGEKRIAKHPKDSQAYLAISLAKIAKVYWAMKEKRYLVMAQETAHIWSYLEAAKSADPNNYDVDFLMGLLHYHIDHFAGMTGFLSSLLITEGNRQKGLTEIQTAAQKGYLLRDIAQSELTSIYLNYEKQPAKALPILQDLRNKFPNNYNYYFTLGVTMVDLRRFAEAEAIAVQIEKNIKSGTPLYVPQLQPRYYQLMGRIHFKRGEYGRAESFFQKAIQDKSFYNARTQARSLVYLGMIHDIRQERKYAEDYYKRVLKVEGAEGAAQTDAKEYLKTPYRGNGK